MTNAPIPMTAPLRILGLDPGLRRTGWGVIAVDGVRLAHVAHGVIAPKDSLPFAERLLCLFDALSEIVAVHGPRAMTENPTADIPASAVDDSQTRRAS